jgi:hypothetical protein
MYGIIFEQMGKRFGVRDIIDRDPFDGRIASRGPDDVPSNPSETVDPDSYGHFVISFSSGLFDARVDIFSIIELYHHLKMCQWAEFLLRGDFITADCVETGGDPKDSWGFSACIVPLGDGVC